MNLSFRRKGKNLSEGQLEIVRTASLCDFIPKVTCLTEKNQNLLNGPVP